MDTVKYYAGTSGLMLPFPNKLSYPVEFQAQPRLAYYASLFNSIEINSSFYKIPMAATVKKWSDMVPEGFRFTFKLWKEITHNKNLAFDPDAITRFIDVINNVDSKKGCLLIQFPPSVTLQKVNQVRSIFTKLKEADLEQGWSMAVEFRHISWYNDDLDDFLKDYEFSAVLHDKSKSQTPLTINTGMQVYLRFHGPGGNYRDEYSDEVIYEYSQYILEWLDEGKFVYVYFNNTMGNAIKNLQDLNRYVLG
jgi:uncharacterized protein YecE (DUF72 family)